MSNDSIALCALSDIVDGGSRGFSVKTSVGYEDLFLIRNGKRILAYLNSCPHTGGPLDWVPDQFLSLDGALIQCATHDALFRIDDGKCVSGPCAGASLTPIGIEVRESEIFLLADLATRPASDESSA